jgi:regulator of replication initiation timing
MSLRHIDYIYIEFVYNNEHLKEGDTNTSNFSLSEDDLVKIAEVLKSSFQHEITHLVKYAVSQSVGVIVDGVLTGLQEKVKSLETENVRLKHENHELKLSVSQLKLAADSSEQYSRRNNLRITGIPETNDENTDEIILNTCKKIDVNMNLSEIDRSHRVGRPNQSGGPRAIIVKFVSYRSRQKMYTARSVLNNRGLKGTFINEDLTKQRSFAFYTARTLVRKHKIIGCWTADGVILVKDKDERIHRITNSSDLDHFDV